MLEIINLETEHLEIENFKLPLGKRIQIADPHNYLEKLFFSSDSPINFPENTTIIDRESYNRWKLDQPLFTQISSDTKKKAENFFRLPPTWADLNVEKVPSSILSFCFWIDKIPQKGLILTRDNLATLGLYNKKTTLSYMSRILEQKQISLIQVLSANKDLKPLIQDFYFINQKKLQKTSTPSPPLPPDYSPDQMSYPLLKINDVSTDHLKDWTWELIRGESWTFICEEPEDGASLANLIGGLEKGKKGQLKTVLKPREILFYEPSPFPRDLTIFHSLGIYSREAKISPQELASFIENQFSDYKDKAEKLLGSFPDELSQQEELNIFLLWALKLRPRVLIVNQPGELSPSNIELLKKVSSSPTSLVLISSELDTGLTSHLGIILGGILVESGLQKEILSKPFHPYTRALFSNSDSKTQTITLPARNLNGCPYHYYCPDALPHCGWEGLDLLGLIRAEKIFSEIKSYSLKNSNIFLEPHHSVPRAWQDYINEIENLMREKIPPMSVACSKLEYVDGELEVKFPQTPPPFLKEIELNAINEDCKTPLHKP